MLICMIDNMKMYNSDILKVYEYFETYYSDISTSNTVSLLLHYVGFILYDRVYDLNIVHKKLVCRVLLHYHCADVILFLRDIVDMDIIYCIWLLDMWMVDVGKNCIMKYYMELVLEL